MSTPKRPPPAETIESQHAQYRAEFVRLTCRKCGAVDMAHPSWGGICTACAVAPLYPPKKEQT